MSDDHLMSLQPGTLIAGRYEVVKCLGAGSMGLVYACRHRELAGHLVAIKVLFPEVAQDKVAAQRFRNEIFASYDVSHHNVVRAYEYIRDGDLVAYTMEYVGGGDLAERLGKSGNPLPINEIVRLLSQMCAGVQAIHEAGIVHRDLKPENVLLTTDGQVKIADFGIAKTGHGPKLTEHGGVVGTIDYVSPEYMLNSQVDWRSDIYALGVLAYEMVTGESPFRGDSVYATMTKRLKFDPAPPSSLRSDCPPALDRIILHALERDPEKRYQSAAEILFDLSELSGSSPGTSVASRPAARPQRYVGPVLSPGEGGQATAAVLEPQSVGIQPRSGDGPRRAAESAPAPEAPRSARPAAPRPDSVRAGVLPPQRLRPEPSEASSAPQPVPTRPSGPYQGTQVINPELFDISSVYADNSTPSKMEKLLPRGSGASGEWSRPSKTVHPNIVRSQIDQKRIRTLSQAVDLQERSIWVDIGMIIIMVGVGIGIGFALLSWFLPDMVSPEVDRGAGGLSVWVKGLLGSK